MCTGKRVLYSWYAYFTNTIYRVGRTGRAGTKGTAYTFITPEEDQFAAELIRALELSRQDDSITPDLRALSDSYLAKKSAGQIVKLASAGYGGKGYKFIESEQSKQQEMRSAEKKAYLFNYSWMHLIFLWFYCRAGIDVEETPEDLDDEDKDKAVTIVPQVALGNINALLGLAPGTFISPQQQAIARIISDIIIIHIQ